MWQLFSGILDTQRRSPGNILFSDAAFSPQMLHSAFSPSFSSALQVQSLNSVLLSCPRPIFSIWPHGSPAAFLISSLLWLSCSLPSSPNPSVPCHTVFSFNGGFTAVGSLALVLHGEQGHSEVRSRTHEPMGRERSGPQGSRQGGQVCPVSKDPVEQRVKRGCKRKSRISHPFNIQYHQNYSWAKLY